MILCCIVVCVCMHCPGSLPWTDTGNEGHLFPVCGASWRDELRGNEGFIGRAE